MVAGVDKSEYLLRNLNICE